ncbi:hypothetical protein RDp07_gp39 [Roseobacter phage RD-1410Ws-07]|uniref:Uncharacterized protein n=2 Tax=Sanyabayvirus DS1410Ws06 TaxID=2844087 RepID=A0A191VYR1_9CAUD|nr:hypothetical protein HYO98_gp42 [Dinoroseobacter phage DS-1410Ws-06]ANJ20699.1 hypothetical protein DSp06_gp42 [Dinoroseobacter phage DS-1410Ws-06]ANJ20850.1 hypothetical protein RDp07_gp39 [Roseobacter phage RD-1410Ws-07]
MMSRMLSPMTGRMFHPMVGSRYEGIEFTPELIKLLVLGRLRRAYERNVL